MLRRASQSCLKRQLAYKPVSSLARNFSLQRVSVKSSVISHSFGHQNVFTSFKRTYASGAEKVIQVPTMGDSISEGTIQKWHKGPGDYVAQDELVVSIETDKIVVEIRAPEAGVVRQKFANDGDTVLVGANLYSLEAGAQAPQAAAKPQEAPKQAAKEEKKEQVPNPPISTPTQPQPQQAKAPQPAAAPQPASKPAAKSEPTPVAPSSGNRSETRVKMTRMRERISNRLKDSQNTYAMLTTFNKIDMSKLMALRDEFKEEFQTKHNVKLGFMSAFVKAAAIALQEQPAVNGVIDGNEIVYRNYVDISVAVATPTGLVVPVLRDADKLSFSGIEKAIAALGKKARDGQLALEDMAGGTFTISNGGVYGSLMGTPIINPPQSAILGMHAINKEAVVVDDQIVIRPIMYVALTYDHRMIDGREAVTFLKKIKEIIEDPRRVILDL